MCKISEKSKHSQNLGQITFVSVQKVIMRMRMFSISFNDIECVSGSLEIEAEIFILSYFTSKDWIGVSKRSPLIYAGTSFHLHLQSALIYS